MEAADTEAVDMEAVDMADLAADTEASGVTEVDTEATVDMA